MSGTPESPTHEENLALLAEANAAGQLAGPLRVGTACPECGQRDVIDVRQVLKLKDPATVSLAGVQTKFTGRIGWVYKCSACGAEGSAAPK